jgi:hypothetical protein
MMRGTNPYVGLEEENATSPRIIDNLEQENGTSRRDNDKSSFRDILNFRFLNLVIIGGIWLLLLVIVIELSSNSYDNCPPSNAVEDNNDLFINQLNPMDNENPSSGYSAFQLFVDPKDSGSIYSLIPSSIIDSSVDMLYVEQITSGLGLRGFFVADVSNVISQTIVVFRRVNSNRIALIAPEVANIGIKTTIEKSFAEGVKWMFDIIEETSRGVLVNCTEWALSPTTPSLGPALTASFGNSYQYRLDGHKSAVDVSSSRANHYRIFLNSNLTYTLETGDNPSCSSSSSAAYTSSPPTSLARSISGSSSVRVSVRRTGLLIDAYTSTDTTFSDKTTADAGG